MCHVAKRKTRKSTHPNPKNKHTQTTNQHRNINNTRDLIPTRSVQYYPLSLNTPDTNRTINTYHMQNNNNIHSQIKHQHHQQNNKTDQEKESRPLHGGHS